MKTTVENINGFPSLVDETGLDIAKMYNVDEARQVNRAVNSHEAAQRLAEQLQWATQWIENIMQQKGGAVIVADSIPEDCNGLMGQRAALAEWEAVK